MLPQAYQTTEANRTEKLRILQTVHLNRVQKAKPDQKPRETVQTCARRTGDRVHAVQNRGIPDRWTTFKPNKTEDIRTALYKTEDIRTDLEGGIPCWHEDMPVTNSVYSLDPYCGKKYLTFWNCAGVISGTMRSIFKNQNDYVSWHIWGYFRPSGLNRISILVLSITDWDLGMSIMTSLIFCHALILKPNISTSRWSTITILVSFFHKFCWSHIAFHKYCHN